jgi:hypothetical protein
MCCLWCDCACDRYNHRTGEWAHTTRLTKFPERVWLSNFDPLAPPAPAPTASPATAADYFASSLQVARKEADRLLAESKKKAAKLAKATSVGEPTAVSGGDDGALNAYQSIRWLLLASDFPGSVPVIPEDSSNTGVVDIQGMCLYGI